LNPRPIDYESTTLPLSYIGALPVFYRIIEKMQLARKIFMTQSNPRSRLSAEKYAHLKAEAEAPYKGLRQFFYVGFGVSGCIGAVVYLARLAAGGDAAAAFPNFALQMGVVALMVWLFRRENRQKS
jgi:Low psii accumulation1 / Rep27